jgi:type II secretory pathway pseudopilin PulG
MRTNRGIILIAAYLVIAVLLILGAAFVGRSISEKNIAQRELESLQAFYLAEAGANYGLNWLRLQSKPPSGTDSFILPSGPVLDVDGGNYTVTIDPDDNNPGTTLKRYKITSLGLTPQATRQVVNEVRLDSYARYNYFTDDEHFRWFGWFRVPVWFITGDHLYGPTQTNSHLHISGDPIFSDLVRTADNFITYMHGGPPNDNPVFEQGIQLGVEPIRMPSNALDLRTAAVQGGLKLTGPTTIVLKNDGTMDVTNSHKGWTNQNMSLPANNALFVEGGDLSISGTLNGQLSAGTNRNVVIPDNLTYNTDPRTNPNSTDMLGLIAERDVVISENAPYNLSVEASIMALGNSFIVENWWQPPAKGTLSTYGGIIQDERGPVGTFNSATNQKASGYTKDYHYDPRLGRTAPPFYPTTGDYISLSWEEE